MTAKRTTIDTGDDVTVVAPVTEQRVIVGEVGGFAGAVLERRPGRIEVTVEQARGEVEDTEDTPADDS
jgi:hypothetical protein